MDCNNNRLRHRSEDENESFTLLTSNLALSAFLNKSISDSL